MKNIIAKHEINTDDEFTEFMEGLLSLNGDCLISITDASGTTIVERENNFVEVYKLEPKIPEWITKK